MTRTLAAATVVQNRPVARDTVVVTYALALDEPVRAGQFAMIHPGSDDRYVLPRPFSILDARPGEIDILIKVAGRGSAALASAKSGDEVRIFAPLGRPFDDPTLRRAQVILVAGGVGIVPLHLLARELKAGGAPDPIAVFGARSPEDLPMELLTDEPAGPWQLWVETDPRDGLRQGLVTEGLQEALDAHPRAVIATCGPTAMMQAVARIGRARGVAVWLCLEEQMGCGAGVCRACVVEDAHEPRMRTVCKEGPVFSLDAIRFLPEDRAAEDTTSQGCAT